MNATEILVCVTCRRGPDDPDAGRRLFDALSGGAGVRVTPVECLQNCEGACTVAFRGGPARWTYVFGACDPDEHAPLLIDAAARYAATADGLIPWRDRPLHLRRNCIARIPPLTPERTA